MQSHNGVPHPALRNRNITLTPELELEGRPRLLYKAVLQLLTDVHEEKISAEDLLAETIRCLLVYRNERQQRMSAALESIKTTQDSMPLFCRDNCYTDSATPHEPQRQPFARPSCGGGLSSC